MSKLQGLFFALLFAAPITHSVYMLVHYSIDGIKPRTKLRNKTLSQMFGDFFSFPAYHTYKLYLKIKPYFGIRYFKECQFKVGESVMYYDKIIIVTKNEKYFAGDELEVEYELPDFGTYKERANVKRVRKLSKLEQAIK